MNAPHAHSATRSLAPAPDEAWPHYAAEEIAAVVGCLEAGTVNQWTGPQVAAFEQAYERHVGTGQAIALANGTVALELALKAFGVGPGDEVVVTPRSFVASAACVSLLGATPVFADVDRDSGNITADSIARVLTPRTKAVIPVHLAGWPADMPAIMALADRHGLRIIEDCAQAHGAAIGGRPVGAFGDAAAFSFCQDKIISTGGEGGLTLFQDADAAAWARSYKDHGKNIALARTPSTPGAFRWLHESIGTNWRMTSLAAAIGTLQLGKLDAWRETRARNAAIWRRALAPVARLRVPWPAEPLSSAFYKFYCYIDRPGEAGERARDAIIQAALAEGLRVFTGSCSEIYRERAFADLRVETLPIAQELGRTSIMVEVHPTLSEARLEARAARLAEIAADILA